MCSSGLQQHAGGLNYRLQLHIDKLLDQFSCNVNSLFHDDDEAAGVGWLCLMCYCVFTSVLSSHHGCSAVWTHFTKFNENAVKWNIKWKMESKNVVMCKVGKTSNLMKHLETQLYKWNSAAYLLLHQRYVLTHLIFLCLYFLHQVMESSINESTDKYQYW